MRSTAAVLTVARFYASPSAGATVGKFLRYIQYRDQVQRGDEGEGLAGLARYVAHRDRVRPEAILFGPSGGLGDSERIELARYVGRSVKQLERPGWPLVAAYRLVVGPEDARGLDLRRLTRQVMRQLERDTGFRLPWIAAEHRNTAHAHVHVLLAARHEIETGRFREFRVTPPRLARMRGALAREMSRQRGALELGREPMASRARPTQGRAEQGRGRPPTLPRVVVHDPLRRRTRHRHLGRRRERGLSWYPLGRALQRLGRQYRRYLEREQREEMRRRSRDGRPHEQELEWEVFV